MSSSSVVAFTLGASFASIASAVVFFLRARRQVQKVRGSPDQVVEVQPPHPTWTAGQKQPNPFGHSRTVSFRSTDVVGGSCYPLVISAYIPRPIALVSTISKNGVVNMAPFSYSGAMSHDPPIIAFSVCRKPGGMKKDTLDNIEENGEMVIHIMSEWFVNAANLTCSNFPPEQDEMKTAGLTPIPSVSVLPPRCEESAVQMECKLHSKQDIKNAAGKVTATLILAEVVMWHIHEDVYDDNSGQGPTTVKHDNLHVISRLGGNTYGTTTYVYDLPRPDRPKTGRKV
ncbi:hypothetical protein CYMTET_54766 [Cymbomonas tetramitiformis]|uniref:Flavin reductase like domain-containing protein n=1 Tax=Cymbomonas tetramitiformis TaxID=36881 RepID=A0AAE0BFP3_9CHLO|nr:hypothetical protein CYMTET_54766 [Cymbomonas tetramitiformis]